MKSIVIEKRFCGPPNSANGGYVCGLLAAHIAGSAEVTLLAPPPLDRRLDIVTLEGGVELRKNATTLATGRRAEVDIPEIPIVDFAEAQEAVHRTPYDASRHPLPRCFVCGPERVDGDGLHIIPVPLSARTNSKVGSFVAPWVPHANLAGEGGAIASEFVWAALDCPTGFAGVGARHLGMTGAETMLLGRMRARIERRPRPDDRCIIVAWPIGRDGRKLFASSALLSAAGEPLAVAQATWILVDRRGQLGDGAGCLGPTPSRPLGDSRLHRRLQPFRPFRACGTRSRQAHDPHDAASLIFRTREFGATVPPGRLNVRSPQRCHFINRR
ncbi:hypothetical protein [Bradyrhizobium sp. LHD-71]|uniref:hypothetical protein n=1 Tax=Bradyrhizobium sp. LHD-71 TaxID=3072141 RepID=UPI00280E1E02|nr:hypothetical protein [Bradyrhizobium sp. LHD-71]MDQ8732158.1 hypothetical protein [Bradyrhizobium sp. LHD-71]